MYIGPVEKTLEDKKWPPIVLPASVNTEVMLQALSISVDKPIGGEVEIGHFEGNTLCVEFLLNLFPPIAST